MSDNISVAGKTIAADEISGVQYQRTKLIFGADGTNSGDVASANPLPVSAYLNGATMQDGTSQLTPAFKTVTLTADGNILAAQTGKIRVLAMTINCDTVNEDVNIEDGSGGTTLWTAENLPLGVTVLPFNPVGWFETTAATALYADITAPGTNTHIAIVYVDVV